MKLTEFAAIAHVDQVCNDMFSVTVSHFLFPLLQCVWDVQVDGNVVVVHGVNVSALILDGMTVAHGLMILSVLLKMWHVLHSRSQYLLP